MNREETIQILLVLQAEKPHSFQNLGAEMFEIKVNLWADEFEDVPYPTVYGAVRAFLSTDATNFAPGIGQIREIIFQTTTKPGNKLSGEEVWNNIVLKALKNSAYKANTEYENLPQQVKKIVGSPATLHCWALMSTEKLNQQVKYTFLKSYENTAENNKKNAKLATSVKKILSKTLPNSPKSNEVERKEPKKLN